MFWWWPLCWKYNRRHRDILLLFNCQWPSACVCNLPYGEVVIVAVAALVCVCVSGVCDSSRGCEWGGIALEKSKKHWDKN